MNQSNHLTGGTVFTGIFASLWDINIFSDINLLIICWIASVLPDIDHTKSPIGKLFFPISKYIDKKFGHRTITHSMIFVLISVMIFKSFADFNMTLIFTLGLISHLIFDMMTVQGVPLLYPFKKNPCVIPANPEARIRSGNIRAELTAFVLFIICGTFCYPLMANGFWLTFNNALGNRKQLIAEFKKSDNILEVDYNFRRNFEAHKGTGYCLKASKMKIIFYDKEKGFVTIFANDVTKSFVLKKTKYTSLDDISKRVKFNDINLIQLDSILENTAVLKGKIIANKKTKFLIDEKEITTNSFHLHYVNQITAFDEVTDMKMLNIKQIQLRQLNEKYKYNLLKYNNEVRLKERLKNEYITASDFRKLEINNELHKLNPTPPDRRSLIHVREILTAEIALLKKDELKLTGYLQVIDFK